MLKMVVVDSENSGTLWHVLEFTLQRLNPPVKSL